MCGDVVSRVTAAPCAEQRPRPRVGAERCRESGLAAELLLSTSSLAIWLVVRVCLGRERFRFCEINFSTYGHVKSAHTVSS